MQVNDLRPTVNASGDLSFDASTLARKQSRKEEKKTRGGGDKKPSSQRQRGGRPALMVEVDQYGARTKCC